MKYFLISVIILLSAALASDIRAENPPNSSPAQTPEMKTKESQLKEREAIAGAKKAYDAGLTAYNNKEYDKAREQFLKSLSLWHNFPETYAMLGDTYDQLKEDGLQFESYRKSLELINKTEAANPEQTKLRDEITRKLDRFNPAYEKIDTLDKEAFNTLMVLGQQGMEADDYLLAEDMYIQVLQLWENDEEAADNLKQVRKKLNEEIGNSPLEENASMADTYFKDGVKLAEQNNFAGAVEKLFTATSLKDYFPEAFEKLAECYEKINRPKEAIKNYRLCLRNIDSQIEVNPNEEKLYNQAQGNLEKIDSLGNEFRKIKSKYTAGLTAVAPECAKKKFTKLAVLIYERILKIDPGNKTATDALVKMKSDTPVAKKSDQKFGDPVKIFDGKTMNGWTVPPMFTQMWSVAVRENSLVYNGNKALEQSLIAYANAPTTGYILNFEVFIQRKFPRRTCDISFVYGANLSDLTAPGNMQTKISVNSDYVGVWYKVKITSQESSFIMEIEGKSRYISARPFRIPTLAFSAQGCIAKFRNVTLQIPKP